MLRETRPVAAEFNGRGAAGASRPAASRRLTPTDNVLPPLRRTLSSRITHRIENSSWWKRSSAGSP
jgi:hypothetical protein